MTKHIPTVHALHTTHAPQRASAVRRAMARTRALVAALMLPVAIVICTLAIGGNTTASAQRTRRQRARRPATRTAQPKRAPKKSANTAATPAPDDTAAPAASTADGADAGAASSDEIGDANATLPEPVAKSEAEQARLDLTRADELIAQNEPTSALAELRRLNESTHFDPPHYYNLGNRLARLGDLNAAVAAYHKAVDQRRGFYPRALNNLGVVLITLGDLGEAQIALTNASRQENFAYPEASYNLGRLYSMRGETELAEREWKRTLKLAPDHLEAAVALARLYALDGDAAKGLSVLDRVRATTETARHNLIEARRAFLLATSDATATTPGAKSATRKTTSATTQSPSSAMPIRSRVVGNNFTGNSLPVSGAPRVELSAASYNLMQQARAEREAGRHEAAATLYRRVIAAERGNLPPAQLELAYSLVELKRYTEAIAVLEPLAERDGVRYSIAYYHLARLYEGQGDLERAAQNYTRASVAYGEKNPQFLLDLARVRERQGDYASALAAFEVYMSIAPRSGTNAEWTTARLATLREKAAAIAPNKNTSINAASPTPSKTRP